MQDTIQIKRRRLTAEVQTLSQLISDTQDMIKYDPYPQDIPSLTTQLINARADLQQAVNELAAIGKAMKHTEGFVADVGMFLNELK